ncbi:uncharacterized protein LOC110835923 [Zootermopsis nevadensis]|uniref:uncharacterized protein LOC110835923 n=1 Tax=Zootermopsis nevadensis TaxID=136037 RepID=UPI000B8E82EF|nr:uncharacterized protein LOC110835923 [Zootermopsis nevadensis]
MGTYFFELTVIVGIIQSGVALECYKCPINTKDIFHCSDPFVNNNYQTSCAKDEDVCLKMSVGGINNHIEERGCANRASVETICNRVKQNFPPEDVTCELCQTDLCNGSSRQENASLLYFLPLCFLIKNIRIQIT